MKCCGRSEQQCSYSQGLSSRHSLQQQHLHWTELRSWREKTQQSQESKFWWQVERFWKTRSGKEQVWKQLVHPHTNLSADTSAQASELLRTGRTFSRSPIPTPVPRQQLLPTPLLPGSVLTSEQNNHVDLLATCSFFHFQLFLLHLVLLKSPSDSFLSWPLRAQVTPCQPLLPQQCHFPFRANRAVN